MEIKNLITRNVNCSELTDTEFARMMIEDMLNAKKVYDSIWYPISVNRHNEYLENTKKYIGINARKYAEKHWKTEAKRNEYVEKEISKFKETPHTYISISFYDFNVEPGSMGISNDCILTYDDLTENAMIRCFNKIKDNEYWKNAKGWILEDHHYSRPQIKLILDDEYADKMNKEAVELTNKVHDFYKDCTYWGD